MLIINPPLALYKHLAALSFLLAGVFSDLLIIRLCLSSAYVCLITNCLLGSPLWPHLYREGHLTVDMLIWGVVCLYVHLCSVTRLLLDEEHVELTEHEEALWRMFYRVGGLSRKLFQQQIAPHMTIATFQKGDNIPVDKYFHITYQGLVNLHVEYSDGTPVRSVTDGSGCIFDFKNLGLLQPLTSPFASHVLTVTAESECTFFQFSNSEIKNIANTRNTKSLWQNVFIGILARIAVQRLGEDDLHSDPAADITKSKRTTDPTHLDPLFQPLTDAELPDPVLAGSGRAMERPLKHIAFCMRRFFTPPWPFGKPVIGVRHIMLPAPVPSEGGTETLEQSINQHNNGVSTTESESLLTENGGSKYESIA